MAKLCKQCGEDRPNDQFRPYYGGRKGRYTTCLTCEKINSRAKYLTSKGDTRSAAETDELEKIHALYEIQRKIGLQPPRVNSGRSTPLVDTLDEMLGSYATRAEAISEISSDSNVVPTTDELTHWLVAPLTEDPEHYDDVYAHLRDKYRPVVTIDEDTKLPVYDDTYKPVLDKIIERFNEYEDTYFDA